MKVGSYAKEDDEDKIIDKKIMNTEHKLVCFYLVNSTFIIYYSVYIFYFECNTQTHYLSKSEYYLDNGEGLPRWSLEFQ